MTPNERPKRIDRNYALKLLVDCEVIFKHLAPGFLDYLVAVKVLAVVNGSYEIVGHPEYLAAYPPDAAAHLASAVRRFASSKQCPRLLLSVMPGKRTGGSGYGSLSFETNTSVYVSPAETLAKAHEADRLEWHRNDHVASMAPMSEELANAIIDTILAQHGRRPKNPASQPERADQPQPVSAATQSATTTLDKVAKLPHEEVAESWPPRVHSSVSWSDLSQMERDQIKVFLKRGRGAVLEVPRIAKLARGIKSPNRHDSETALSLDQKGLTEKAGRTGRRLIAIPRGMPSP